MARSMTAAAGLSVRVPSAKATIADQPSGSGIDTTVEGVSRFLYVQNAQPLPPVPDGYPGTVLDLVLPLVFSLH